MRLSVADIDWTQLSAGERDTLERVAPKLEDGYSLTEIAEQFGVDAGELEDEWENLAARVMALSGHIELPPLSDEEFEALKESISAHGQKNPILRNATTGEIVDGEHRLRACYQLGIEPKFADVDGSADELRGLALVLNLARRHMSASARRGIIKAELLRDPSRSDRAIASFVGVSDKTVAAVRRELEHTAEIPQQETRVGRDGVQKPTPRRTPTVPSEPREKTIRVNVPIDMVEQWVGGWVTCRAFRLAERRPGVYELEVQLLDTALVDDDRVDAIERYAADLAERNGCTQPEAVQELLRTACEVFAREIPTLADLTQQEAEWLVSRVAGIAA